MGDYSINTPKFRVSFCNIIDGKENDDGELRYGSAMLFEKGEMLKELKALGAQILTDKFGSDKKKWPKGVHKPWRDQGEKDADNPNRDEDTKAYDGYQMGALYINCNAASDQPEVVDHALQPILKKRDVYSGCYGIANIDMFWFDRKNKAGVIVKRGLSCSMNCFQKLEDGEPLGGGARVQAASVFSPVEIDNNSGAADVFADEDDDDPMA